jgi:hypothetical protein
VILLFQGQDLQLSLAQVGVIAKEPLTTGAQILAVLGLALVGELLQVRQGTKVVTLRPRVIMEQPQ